MVYKYPNGNLAANIGQLRYKPTKQKYKTKMGRRLVWGLFISLFCFAISLFLAPNDLRQTSSLVFAIKDDVHRRHLNTSAFYGDALHKAILFFEGQRSGKLPASQRVKWRGDSALNDGQSDHVNLAGGYYDAGDNVKFGWTMAYTVTLLSWAAVEYRQEITSAGKMDSLRHSIRWATDFLLQSHTSSTTFYTQVGDGNADHGCWERPEDMDTARTLYKITRDDPGSEAAADASAALSSASIVFKSVDSAYSSKLLQHSKSVRKPYSSLRTSIELLTMLPALSTALTLATRYKYSNNSSYWDAIVLLRTILNI
ncbi:unnamed protein product [Linum grandiflorum]